MNDIGNKVEADKTLVTKMKEKYRLYLFFIFLLSLGVNQFGSFSGVVHPFLLLVFLVLIVVILIGYIKYMIKFSRALGNSMTSTIFYVIIGILPIPILCLLPAIFLIRQYTKVTGIKVGFIMGDKKK